MVISVPLSKAFSASLCWPAPSSPGNAVGRCLNSICRPSVKATCDEGAASRLKRAARSSGGICELCMRPFSSTQV
ncbi:Uncharacterised protein [Acinetobacter baumannii]|nr:Uncharacterised protein [Acinetobacter baumannii]